jgi:hypothetical protein
MAQDFQFYDATKEQAFLRLAVYGIAGAGKTLSLLLMGKGIVEQTNGLMAVIDTENKTASKYSGVLEIPGLEGVEIKFKTLNLTEPTIPNTIKAINSAAKYGANFLIIDSLSHSWKELLIEVDRLAKVKYHGNTWAAWNEGTPLQKDMVTAIQQYPGHLGVTLRAATDWLPGEGPNGKTAPQRVGLKPEQGKGIEFEFDMLGNISGEHMMLIEKDRSGKYQDQIIDKPGIEFGKELLAWLNSGVERTPLRTREDLINFAAPLGLEPAHIRTALDNAGLEFSPYIWEEMKTAIVNFANGLVVQAVE